MAIMVIFHMMFNIYRSGGPVYLMYDKYDESWSCESSSGRSYDVR